MSNELDIEAGEEKETIETTNIPLLNLPKNLQRVSSATLTPDEKDMLGQLEQYVQTILLPQDDPNYAAERAWVDEPCLKRYLRAAKWRINDAEHRIKYTIEWRREYKPNQIDPKEVEPEAVTGKMHLNGFDKHGRPILYLRPALENTKAGPGQVKFVVFLFERAIKLMSGDVENIVIMVDFDNTSARKSPGIGIAKEFMHVLSSHYPERLGMACVINAPWYFWSFFTLISPFIDPVTKEKIKFVALDDPTKATHKRQWVNLEDVADESQLESEYGGENAFVYEHEVYWKTLLERTGLIS